MVRIIFLIVISACFTNGSFAQNQLTFKITGMEVAQGQILISIFNSENSFMKEALKSTVKKVSSTDQPVTIVFDNLPPGTYAMSTFHDENNNGELDSNFMGIPKEPYGFSNNARGSFGPPSFEDCKFEVNTNSVAQNIVLK